VAAASLTVFIEGKEIRKFGSNRSCVKTKYQYYRNITQEQFVIEHPNYSKNDLELMQLTLKLNKR
jgi:hypothetical protein